MTSDLQENRFTPSTLEWETISVPSDYPMLAVDRLAVKQRVTGFGGAFTDAATANINRLNRTTQDNLLK